MKTCTYDCIYCQLGPTTCKTVERKPWVPLEKVLADLRPRLASNPDYVTLSGSGEPTLHSQTGELIARIKALTAIPVAVLTNGSLLWEEAVRQQLLQADLVIPSLDAGDEATFRAVNRPHVSLAFEQVLEGLVRFRQQFQGEYWLEVFTLDGHNTASADVARLAECVKRIGPDRVQLNTVARPPAEPHAVGVSRERLAELAQRFEPPAEVIPAFRDIHQQPEYVGGRNEVLAMLQRRPCSIEDVARGLGMHQNEAIKYLEELRAEGTIASSITGNKHYYRVTGQAHGRSEMSG